MKVAPLLVGSSLVVLTCSQTVDRIRTTYINGDQSLGVVFQPQPIAFAQPFQQYLHSTGLPTYAQSLHPIQVQQGIVSINRNGQHGIAPALRSATLALPISHSTTVPGPSPLRQEPQAQVFTFQADPFNQIRLLHRDEPPRFEQVTIKDPKVSVFNVQKPPNPPMTIFQVRRELNPPATIEFVNEGSTETQVTVLDDADDVARVEGVKEEEENRAIQPRQRLLPPPPGRKVSMPRNRRVFRNDY